MAKPNRVMAYLPKRSPIAEIRCTSMAMAQRVAEEQRKVGYDAKATSRKYGSRKNPSREYTCFVYRKVGAS